MGGARHLERENEGLHKKVKALERKLERVQDADELPIKAKRSRRAAASVADLQKEVQGLRNQVRRLEKVRSRIRVLSQLRRSVLIATEFPGKGEVQEENP